jgi:hypothetical protein
MVHPQSAGRSERGEHGVVCIKLNQPQIGSQHEQRHRRDDKVRGYPIRKMSASVNTAEQICAAVDMACIWYWKEVLCLQRSAATACLLAKAPSPTRNGLCCRSAGSSDSHTSERVLSRFLPNWTGS